MDPREYMPQWWLELELVQALSRHLDTILMWVHLFAVGTMVAATVKSTRLVNRCNDYLYSLAMRTSQAPSNRPIGVLMLWFILSCLVAAQFVISLGMPLNRYSTEHSTFAFVWGVIALAYTFWTYRIDRRTRRMLRDDG
jgi:hypothetical protein